MKRNKPKFPDWVRLSDHTVIVQTCQGTTGTMSFEGATPHLVGEKKKIFLNALRRDVSTFRMERAKPIFRDIPKDEPTIAPETCTPYRDANALGFYLKNVLPLVFVKTRKGEILPDTRVAIKYMRENAKEFASTLQMLGDYAHRIFKPDEYDKLRARYPVLVSDVAQPYSSFTNLHMSMGAGCYVMTPPGVATILGPPINQKSLLGMYSGLIETEWYHSEFFMVFDAPHFKERTFIIKPDTILGQFYFVSLPSQEKVELVFSDADLGADPAYRSRSLEVGFDQYKKGTNVIISKVTGTKSISVACPHCWVSVTAAAEQGVPGDHVRVHDFYQGYKALRGEYYHELAEKHRSIKKKEDK